MTHGIPGVLALGGSGFLGVGRVGATSAGGACAGHAGAVEPATRRVPGTGRAGLRGQRAGWSCVFLRVPFEGRTTGKPA